MTPRKKMDQILGKWGHDVYLQRRLWDDEDNKFLNKLEIHTVRHMYPSNRALPRTLEEKVEGLTNTVELLYFFRYNANPGEGDRIYDHDPNSKTTWLIDWALPMRGRGGQIVYWTTGVTREGPN